MISEQLSRDFRATFCDSERTLTGGIVPPIGRGRQKALYSEVAKNKQAPSVSDVTSEPQHARLLGNSALDCNSD